MKLQRISHLAIITGAIMALLVLGRSLLIPLVFAIFLWFLVREMRGFLRKTPIIGKHIPIAVASLLCAGSLITIIAIFLQILSVNIKSLAQNAPSYQSNINTLIIKLEDKTGISAVDWRAQQLNSFELSTVFEPVLNGVSDLISSAILILLFAIFLFLEERYLRTKISRVFPDKQKRIGFLQTVEEIEDSVAKYLGLKTLISLFTGLLSYFVLVFVKIDAPIFWAFIIFLMNFIPSIGSLIGTLFPAIFTLLQFGELGPFLIVLGVIGTIQILIGNFIEPKLMGNSMNVSAFVAILALSFWGVIWGVVGMGLSVPITVILILILSKFEATKPLAILLSEKGELTDEQ